VASVKSNELKTNEHDESKADNLALAVVLCFCSLLAAQGPLGGGNEPLPPIEVGVEFHFSCVPRAASTLCMERSRWRASEELCSPRRPAPRASYEGWAFDVTLRVEDRAIPLTPEQAIPAEVSAPLLLEWAEPPKVRDNRIDGVVQVSNSSTDIFDLTFIVEAVAETGARQRLATSISS